MGKQFLRELSDKVIFYDSLNIKARILYLIMARESRLHKVKMPVPDMMGYLNLEARAVNALLAELKKEGWINRYFEDGYKKGDCMVTELLFK